jgi:hypothetical protein
VLILEEFHFAFNGNDKFQGKSGVATAAVLVKARKSAMMQCRFWNVNFGFPRTAPPK